MCIECVHVCGLWMGGGSVCVCHKRKIMLASQYPYTMMFAGSVTISYSNTFDFPLA